MPRLTNSAKLLQQLSLRFLIDGKALANAYDTPWSDISKAFSMTSTKLVDEEVSVENAYPLLKQTHSRIFTNSKHLSLYKVKFGLWLKNHFGLSDIAYQILFILMFIQKDNELSEITNTFGDLNDKKCYELLATAIQCTPHAISKELRSNMPLLKYKLIALNRMCCVFSNKLTTSDILDAHFFNDYFNPEEMLCNYLIKVESPELSERSFRRLNRDITWMTSLLTQYKKNAFSGCNILLYGEPGTGKTQLSRVLAEMVGLQCFEVSFADHNGDQLNGEERLNKLAMSRHFIETRKNLIVFDELEDAIPMGSPFTSYAGPQKRWFNELLETNPVPVIWISNAIEHLDPAFLRRFDYCLKVTHPSDRHKKQMLKCLLQVKGEPAWLEEIASHKQISAADIDKAAYVVLSCNATNDKQKAHYFKNMLAARGASISTHSCNQKNAYVNETVFSPDLSNTSMPLTQISDIVERSKEGRFLLHGIPGTGKTGYVHYLAKKIGKEIVCKSGSDLLGMFVGESEKSIRDMFNEATQKKAILLLDEADSFFSDRAGHSSEWRTTMVNEMLVQLERFQGIFFASTNLPDTLDKAITRRFDFSVSFTYLTDEQIIGMIAAVTSENITVTSAQIAHLQHITPADFSVAARQARLKGEEITLDSLLTLLAEQSLSRNGVPQRIGFL